MKRTIHTLNSTLALLHFLGLAASIVYSLMEGHLFTLEEIILAPVTVFWFLSAFFLFNPAGWMGSLAGGLVVLYNGLLLLGLAWIHIRFGHLDPSDGTLVAVPFGALSVLAALFLISGLVAFRKDWCSR